MQVPGRAQMVLKIPGVHELLVSRAYGAVYYAHSIRN